jgi:steroid delta-isomerase-like uncharacterized protein
MKTKEEQNKEIVKRYWNGKWKDRNPAILDELQTSDVVYNGPDGEIVGREAYIQIYNSYLSALHDTRITIEDLVAEGDKVVSRVVISGVQKGALGELPPTGKTVTLKLITIFLLADGKITEEWEAYDELGMMQQLGMELRPKEGVK